MAAMPLGADELRVERTRRPHRRRRGRRSLAPLPKLASYLAHARLGKGAVLALHPAAGAV